MSDIPGKPNPFTHWLPHSAVSPDNPLFAYAVRRVGWWHNWASPPLYGAYIVAWTVGGLVFIGAGALALLLLWQGVDYNLGDTLRLHSDFTALAFVIGVYTTPLLDYGVLGSTLYGLISKRTPEHGDLLHMTHLTGADVVAAQHAAARVRVWPLTVVLFGGRLAALILLALNTFWLEPVLAGQFPRFNINPTPASGLSSAEVAFAGIVMSFLTVEVFWRMRLVTALGVTLATRFRTVGAAFAGGAFVLLGTVTLPQVLFGFSVYDLLYSIIRYSPFPFLGVFSTLVAAGIIYFAYFALENVALRRAQRYVFREGRE